MPAMKPCDKCSGSGAVARDRRKLENGEVDPTDLRHSEICGRCGGSGRVREDYAAVPDKAPGFIADQF